MKTIVVFCEGDFECSFRKPDADARPFADGVAEGAKLHVAAPCLVYVLPDDQEEMTNTIHEAMATMALEDAAEKEAQELLRDADDPGFMGYQ